MGRIRAREALDAFHVSAAGRVKMEVFKDFLGKIEDTEHRKRTEEVLGWVMKKYPNLEPKIAWNQPMFTDHGTFIVGFSVAKHHLAMSPEKEGITRFADEIVKAGYDHGSNLMRMKWEIPVNYKLLERIIEFNIAEKAGLKTFWR